MFNVLLQERRGRNVVRAQLEVEAVVLRDLASQLRELNRTGHG